MSPTFLAPQNLLWWPENIEKETEKRRKKSAKERACPGEPKTPTARKRKESAPITVRRRRRTRLSELSCCWSQGVEADGIWGRRGEGASEMGSGSFLKVLAKNFDVLAGYELLPPPFFPYLALRLRASSPVD